MANISKEERARREVAEKEQIRKEIEEQVRSEMNTTNSSELEKENSELKSQLSEMMKMIKELQDKKVENDSIVAVESESVGLTERIQITSMTNGGINMKTSTDGTARFFRLEKIGQTIPIMYEHLINCINTDRWLFEDGLVYINNEKVIREQCLEDFYRKFITPEKIENIMDFDIETIKTLVSSTTKTIQETIVTLIAQKINDGGYIDMNKVDIIGKCCNPIIDIRELANKLR